MYYKDAVTTTGRLRDLAIIENIQKHPVQAADLILQMYGMIWLLAEHIASEQHGESANPKLYVDGAAEDWEDGVSVSPGMSHSKKDPWA